MGFFLTKKLIFFLWKFVLFFIVHVSIIHRPHVYCMWYSLFTIRMFNWTWLSFWLKMTGIMLCKDKDRAFLKDGQEFVKTVFLGVIGLLVWIMMLCKLHAEKPWVFITLIGRWQGFEICWKYLYQVHFDSFVETTFLFNLVSLEYCCLW